MMIKISDMPAKRSSFISIFMLLILNVATAGEPDSSQSVMKQDAPAVDTQFDRSKLTPNSVSATGPGTLSIDVLQARHEQVLERIDALKFEVRTHGRTARTDRMAKRLLAQLEGQKADAEEVQKKMRERQAEMFDKQANESEKDADRAKEQHRKTLRLLMEQQERASQVIQKLIS